MDHDTETQEQDASTWNIYYHANGPGFIEIEANEHGWPHLVRSHLDGAQRPGPWSDRELRSWAHHSARALQSRIETDAWSAMDRVTDFHLTEAESASIAATAASFPNEPLMSGELLESW